MSATPRTQRFICRSIRGVCRCGDASAMMGWGPLVRVTGTMDSEKYKEVLEENLLPWMNHRYPGREMIFQNNNDRKQHTPALQRLYRGKGLHRMPWPNFSPDLALIQNLWSLEDRSVKERRPGNADELFRILQAAWTRIPLSTIHNIVDSMPRRLEDVICLKGYPTSY